jgi:hypothetical protein
MCAANEHRWSFTAATPSGPVDFARGRNVVNLGHIICVCGVLPFGSRTRTLTWSVGSQHDSN